MKVRELLPKEVWNYFEDLNANNANEIISGCIFYAIGKPFSAFWDGWTKVTLPSLSIEPNISTWDTIPAIFFSGKSGVYLWTAIFIMIFVPFTNVLWLLESDWIASDALFFFQ